MSPLHPVCSVSKNANSAPEAAATRGAPGVQNSKNAVPTASRLGPKPASPGSLSLDSCLLCENAPTRSAIVNVHERDHAITQRCYQARSWLR